MVDDAKHFAVPGPNALTKRELEILQLLARNLSNREIADHLFVALTTVKWYNRQIFNKLAVESRQQAVERAFALGLLHLPAQVPNGNLPVQLTPFVGRVSELDDLTRLLSHPNTRFVTILAPGGMGKTRVALAVAQAVTGQFEDGVHFVPCAPLTSPIQLIPTIADTVGCQFFPDSRTPKLQLLNFLSKKRMLIVLDNFEQLVEDAGLVAEFLSAAPQMKVLVTSRERLNLESETVYPLGGMPYPMGRDRENLVEYEAVDFFVTCARRVNSSFVTLDELSIARIAQLVQGMPLALEIAAAWSLTFTPAEIAEEIERSADFLRTTMRNVPEHLQSIRTVFETTWRRLSDDERRGFSGLSVFRSGFTRAAAQAVTAIDAKTLHNLYSKALLWRNLSSNRFELHELLRQYGEEHLRETEEHYRSIMDKHSQWYAEYCEQTGELLKGPQLKRGLQAIDDDFNNIRSGWQWAVSQLRYDLLWKYLFATYYFAWLRNRLREVEPWYSQMIEILIVRRDELRQDLLLGTLLGLQTWIHASIGARGRQQVLMQRSLSIFDTLLIASPYPITIIALSWIGWLLILDGQVTDGKKFCEEGILLAQRHGLQFELALACVIYGYGHVNRGDYDSAEPLVKRAAQVAQELQQPHLLGAVSYYSAVTHFERKNYREAKPLYVDIIEVFRELGDWWNMCLMYTSYIEILLHEHDYDDALSALRDFRAFVNHSGNRDLTGNVLVLFTKLLAATGDKVRAAEVGSFCLTALQSWSQWHWIEDQLTPLLTQLERELPKDLYAAARKNGQTTTLEVVMNAILP